MDKEIVMLASAVHTAFDTRIFHKEALSLVNAGHRVHLIIPHTTNETVSGVNILAIPKPASGFQQLFITPWHIFRRALSFSKSAIIHIHDSELLVIGVLLKLLGRKVIYDAHEDTPRQLAYQHWIPLLVKPFYIAFYFLLERFCGLIFDVIIIAEPVIGRHYPKKKTLLIRNFVIAERFETSSVIRKGNNVIYIGLLSKPRGLMEMVRAIEMIPESTPTELTLGGKFAPSSLEKEIVDSPRVNYIGWVSYENISELLSKSAIGIITPQPNKRYTSNYPVKLFEYMAAGLPVIASRYGELAKFVEEGDCGVLVDPTKPDEIARAINHLLQNPEEALKLGENGKKLILEKYNWSSEAKKLIDLYENLIK